MGVFVPKTLQRAKRWAVWRYEDNGSAKPQKVPYSAYYNGKASTANLKAWAYYSQAEAKLLYSDFDGLGYLFTAGDGLTFVDLDHCIDDEGELSPFANEILALFPKTYTEYSVSETGLHLVVKGNVPAAYKNEAIGLEIYNTGRYMAFTGNVIEALEPQPAQEALNVLIERYQISAQQSAPVIHEPQGGELSDSVIISKAKNGGNGSTFSQLWAGDWSAYSSQSEADLRLTSILYYYSRSSAQVKRLFRESGLGQREKAQRDDYLDRLIDTVARRIDATALAKPQERRNVQGGINTNPAQKNALEWRAGAKKRQGLTDTPDSRSKRAFRK